MLNLDEYIALESIGCETLFDDIIDIADEGIGATLRSGAKYILDIIEKIIHKLVDLGRKITGRNSVVIPKDSKDTYYKIMLFNITELVDRALTVKDKDGIESLEQEYARDFGILHDEYADFNKLSTSHANTSDPNEQGYEISINKLKAFINVDIKMLNKIKSELKNPENSYKDKLYRKIITIIAERTSCTNKLLYNPVTSVNSKQVKARDKENNNYKHFDWNEAK